MAGEEAEKKNISRLDFNIADALNSLDLIDSKLKKISETSESYTKKISQNLNTGLKIGNTIDEKSITKDLKKVEDSTIKMNSETIQKIVDNDKIAQRNIAINHQNNLEKDENNQRQHERRLEEINARYEANSKTTFEKISEYMKTYLIYQGFNMLKNSAKEVIDEMIDVEYQMVAIDRVLNESSLNIDTYRDKLIKLASDYGNSFNNVADITLRLAQAGFDSQESLALTEKTLLALNTAELNATQATDDMVAIMAQWGLNTGNATEQAKEYGDIIDKINKVADNFPTTSEDILDALKKTSSAFNLAGASIDETIATIVAAEKASQRGGKAIGTALSNISQQLKDAGRLTTVQSLGIDVYTDESQTQFKSLIDILGELSEKMQQLKNDGKENSVEMQNLLEVFTVFRRNIGASLLGEMAGEDSTYAEVLKTSIDSVGYSIQENEKYMKTAKAAQEQFNATLLELKTEIWDNGLEDVFRSLLLLGGDLANVIKFLVKNFGALPTTIGAVTLAFTTLNDKIKIAKTVTVTNLDGTKKLTRQYSDWVVKIKEVVTQLKNENTYITKTNNGGVKLQTNVAGMAKGMTSLAGQTALATLKTIGLEAATIALNAALSLGLSVAITAAITLIDNLIHAEEKYIEKVNEEIEATQEKIDTLQSEKDSIDDLIKEYEELNKKKDRTPEEESKIYETQLKINSLIKDQKDKIDFANKSYDEQLNKAKAITLEMQKQIVAQKELLVQEKAQKTGRFEAPGFFDKDDVTGGLLRAGIKYEGANLKEYFSNFSFDEQIQKLEEWRDKLVEAGESGSEAYDWVKDSLDTLYEQQQDLIASTDELNTAQAELFAMQNFTPEKIKNAEDYKNVLDLVNNSEVSYKDTLVSLLKEAFPEYNAQTEIASGNLSFLDSRINTHLTTLQNYADKYAILKNAQDEFNSTGELTIGTLQGLINNDLLQYLTIQDGKLRISTQSMLNMAEASKVAAIESLKDAASKDIEKLAIGDVQSMSNIAKGAIAQFGNNAETAGKQSQTAAGKITELAAALDTAIKAQDGKLGEGIDVADFQRKAESIRQAYLGIANSISKINITTASYSPKTVSTGSGSTYTPKSTSAATDATKAAEEEYKKRLEDWKSFVSDRENLETRWVKKQKELGELSNKDFLYITEQRIKRYESYLNQLSKMTWLNAEDRAKLEKEYTEEIEDLQLDYFDYLKDILDDEIELLEDQRDKDIKSLEEANKAKIQAIKDEAQARIDALKKVEDETDRIRAKEDYLEARRQHLDDISYWEQRTGREAQEALLEARKNLEDLDKEWEQQLEDWSIEDQIAAIEEQRDAQIKAIEDTEEAEIKTIEDTTQAQIDSLQATYDAKVKMFSESNRIIYENSVIESENLYNVYKTNFIDPLAKELENLNKPTTSSTAATQTKKQEYSTYKIKSGDTLSSIAAKYNTTVSKIMGANPSIKNKNLIYTGDTLKIPKFHEGGMFGGVNEGLALLKRGEVILKPEWSSSLNRMMKYFDNLTAGKPGTVSGRPEIQVNGDLIKVEASIRSQTDADYLTKRLEKMLESKFNLKK